MTDKKIVFVIVVLINNFFVLLAQSSNNYTHFFSEMLDVNASKNLVTSLFTVDIDGQNHSFTKFINFFDEGSQEEFIKNKVVVKIAGFQKLSDDIRFSVELINISQDTLVIENFVPFNKSKQTTYITASGPWELARARLFRPDLSPVSLMLPDNAWEMGYASFEINEKTSLCALARRSEYNNAARKRYSTSLFPGGSVKYSVYVNKFSGVWQCGLKLIFRDKYLYDLDEFDNSLFERDDLKWIRNKYLLLDVMAWDEKFYDRKLGEYSYQKYIEGGEYYLGGYDIFAIWPTWPTLGLDERNQWEMYESLPGGLKRLRKISEDLHSKGVRFYISYNPWDQSTRNQNHHEGMTKIISELDADGVTLDTRGKSSYELQRAADKAKPGVVMFSEGMAVVKDMPGIISGRAHNAIFLQPVLNLNKLIKPEFAIFRVLDAAEASFIREASISFFNGYGNELNMFRPGRPDYLKMDLKYLGSLTKILRENSSAFHNNEWTPLINTTHDRIYVNEWMTYDKRLYTIFSLYPEGFSGKLFEIERKNSDTHFIDLINHKEIEIDSSENLIGINYRIEGFNSFDLGTRNEGSVGCVVEFNKLLNSRIQNGIFFIDKNKGTKIVVTAGNPSYQNIGKEFIADHIRINPAKEFQGYQGKFVVQLFDNSELIDENILYIKPGTPQLISSEKELAFASTIENMIFVKGGEYNYYSVHGDDFIPYPDNSEAKKINVDDFYIDKFPVTNRQYKNFIDETGYLPADTSNYLKHWSNGTYSLKDAEKPVVYISIDDAIAYARWDGKRLPTAIEWQYAAQAGDSTNLFPWGREFDSTKCNCRIGKLTDVDQFAEGKNSLGIYDLVGNVWQLTSDVYYNGSYNYIIIKGGSYFKPTSSWWYVQGGPQPLNYDQWLLQVSPGFERNATVGFRCVSDVKIK
ncbi:MAG: formylglycine-generating enzyme family protein [Melioribacteraceae bacterium]|nr:formylglycine-generating enzyme family protein [Melioribacteraceae bacterium]